jgi:hemolysin activation/secretion protein
MVALHRKEVFVVMLSFRFLSVSSAARIQAPALQAIAFAAWLASTSVWAQVPGITPPDPAPEQRRQLERERTQQERLQPDTTVRSPEAVSSSARLPQGEVPCFVINTISLQGDAAERFQWLLPKLAGPQQDDSPQGKCLGAQAISVLLTRAQDALVERGFVTSRVLAQAQDLKTGALILTLVPGRLRDIRFAPADSNSNARQQTTLRNAFAGKVGGILNLRDLEQTLENLKRVPTADADFKIEPAQGSVNGVAAQPGMSDVVITYRQSRPLRGSLSLDDSGSDGTGKYQGSFTLSYDNPSTLNDLFYFTLNNSLGGGDPGPRGTLSRSAHYSLPLGYWLLAANASRSRYYQNVVGASQDYRYSGTSANADVKLSRLIYRDAVAKTTASVRAFKRESQNYIDDTEVEVQRRQIGGWELGLAHKAFIGRATLDTSVNYKRGTGAFDSLPSPEEAFGEGTSRFKLVTADANLVVPFKVGEQNLRYSGNWRAQFNRSPLTPQDRFAIGGRHSVRGFDGENSLAAERGWTLRNDISAALGQSGQEFYVGLDYGQVGGPSSEQLAGKKLAGAVLGLRGSFQGLQYDIFWGEPIDKPENFRTSGGVAGFHLNYSF